MTNGIDEIKIAFKELVEENFLCNYDLGNVIFKHNKFYISRQKDTGEVVVICARCEAVYQIREPNK